jgi:hypothetical protein
MNIFVLDPNPIIAASYHCDQHLHKMVLESAQLLSTAAHIHFPHLKAHIYAPAYQNHPCSIWVSASPNHMVWLCSLATALNEIRETNGSNRHASMDVIDAISANLTNALWGTLIQPTYFAKAMYAHIKIRPDLDTVGKYRLYYRKKSMAWGLTGSRMMSYKGRTVPDFMEGFTV